MTTSNALVVFAFLTPLLMTFPLCTAKLFLSPRSIIGALLLALLALALPGCSAVKLGYNNAPEITYWWLDSYLDFGDSQPAKVRGDLIAMQAWHRQTELPAWVSTLETMQGLAPGNVTA